MHYPSIERLRREPKTAVKVVGLPLVVLLAIITNLPSGSRGSVETPPASDAQIETFIEHEVGDAGIPGAAMAIVRDGAVTDVKAFGTADDHGRPVTPQTPFVIGSLAKSITALAVLQLVDDHALSLDDPVRRYVPRFELADPAVAARITVRELLNQTSGIPASAGERPLGEPETALDAQVQALGDVAPESEPGTAYAYSNANYEVLGSLIERVSGEPYAAYVQHHVFEPLQMRHSFTGLAAARSDGLTDAHRLWFGLPQTRSPLWRNDLQPAGFLAASAEDLGHLVAAELDGGVYEGTRVASSEAIARSQQGSAPMGMAEAGRYGFGWADLDVGGLRVVGHVGSTTDMAGVVFFAPDKRVGVVLLMNAQSTLYELVHKADFIGTAALQQLAGREPGGTLGLLYPAVDAFAIGLIGFAVWRLATVARRLRNGTRRPLRAFGRASVGVALALFLYIVVPFEILFSVPRLLAAPWTTLVRIDIGLVLLAFAVLRLATGLLIIVPTLWARARSRRHATGPRSSRPEAREAVL